MRPRLCLDCEGTRTRLGGLPCFRCAGAGSTGDAMPFRSEAQRRYLMANHPDIAKQFEEETPVTARLPEHAGRPRKSQRGDARLSSSSRIKR